MNYDLTSRAGRAAFIADRQATIAMLRSGADGGGHARVERWRRETALLREEYDRQAGLAALRREAQQAAMRALAAVTGGEARAVFEFPAAGCDGAKVAIEVYSPAATPGWSHAYWAPTTGWQPGSISTATFSVGGVYRARHVIASSPDWELMGWLAKQPIDITAAWAAVEDAA